MVQHNAPKPPRLQIPIRVVMVGGMTLVLLLAVGGLLFINFQGARDTLRLVEQRARISLELLESQVRGRLAPVEAFGLGLAELIADGEIDVNNPEEAAETFRLAMTAVPQAAAVVFVSTDFDAVRYSRGGGALIEVVDAGLSLAGLGDMAATTDSLQGMLDVAAAMGPETLQWLPPLWVGDLGQPALALEVPVNADGVFLGVVLVVVELGDVAQFLAELEARQGTNAFVLYGKDHVLAHPSLANMMAEYDNDVLLPTVDMFEDPAFAVIRGDGQETSFAQSEGVHYAYANKDYEVSLRELAGLGQLPWQIGLSFPASDRGEDERAQTVIYIGIAILLVSALITSFVGNALAHPARQLAMAAERVTALEIAAVPRLRPSRFRELGRAATAFNSMTTALQWFERYVPKKLVTQLMDQAAGGAIGSEQREVTVMFTDIRGFSTMSEQMQPQETADLLNAHFDILSRCIEAEGGTVDKFIGDSVMAFWGAPEPMADHRSRAVRAAQAIRRAVEADNEDRRARGAVPVPVRVGLHTGPVVVGNIGAETRLNYTVVGDTVNAASRLEQLGKDQAAEDCVVLLSEETAGDNGGLPLTRIGEQALKGKERPLVVFRLS